MTLIELIAARERERRSGISEITDQQRLQDLKKQIFAEMDQCPNASVFIRLVKLLEEINNHQATLAAEKKSTR